MHPRTLAVAVVVLAGSSLAADVRAQTTWYVDDDACPDTGTGTEADPFCSIQDGIDAASDADTVLVEPGTYHELIDFSGKAVTLQSTEGQQVTTVDAAGLYDSVVRCVDGEDQDTVLDGFTIRDGYAVYGGGMYNEDSSPTVVNCTFEGNEGYHSGGGMCNENSSPTVVNCTFEGNEGYYSGGGMYNFGGAPKVSRCTFRGNLVHQGAGMYNSFSSAKVTNCTFEGNPAIGPGGGMYNAGGTPEVSGSTFSGNSATEGAGMFNDNSSPTVSDCTFEGNSALYYDGGGIFNHYSSPTVTDCVFIGNSAGDDGAGMCNAWTSSPRVTRCTFEGNTAGDKGGGGGMSNRGQSDPVVTDCAFNGNSARYGGGMYNFESKPDVIHCDFTANSAYGGGGMCNDGDSTPAVTESAFIGNSATFRGGGMYNYESSSTVTNCAFTHNSGGSGMCNIAASPDVTNCTFEENTSIDGAGISNAYGSPTVRNCMFRGNSASIRGGAMYAYEAAPTVINSTFTGNWSPDGRAMAFDSYHHEHPSHLEMANCIVWDGPDWLWNNDGSTITITFSDVQGGWTNDECPVEHPACNIDADPLFVPGPDGCLYLSQTSAGQAADSPCVDIGSDTAENFGLHTLTTRSDEIPDAGIVDMGYHYPVTNQPLIMGDYDRDLDVDLVDFAVMQNCFTGQGPIEVRPCCRIFDFEPDSDVDLNDYGDFAMVLNR